MATVEIRKNKNGHVTSIRLRQYAGRDENGIEYERQSKTVKVPANLTQRTLKRFIEEERIKFEDECAEGLHIGKIRFREYAEYVLQLKAATGVKRSTLERYESMLKRINKAIGRFKLADITVMKLNKFYMSLSEDGQNEKTGEGLSPKTILEHHRLISTILGTAYNEGLIAFNPAERATTPRQEKHEPEFFTAEQLKTILKASDNEPIQWRSLTYFLALTGCRRGEALGLSWSDVDFEKGLVTIHKNLLHSDRSHKLYLDTPKTSNSIRIIKVPKTMLNLFEELQVYQSQQKEMFGDFWHETGLVWTRYRSNGERAKQRLFPGDPMHPDSLNAFYRKFGKRLKIKIHPHMFRHTLPSLLIPEGVPVAVISKQLGHSEPAFTASVYTHILQESTAEAEDTYAELLLGEDK